jgi:hypothetical protein
MKVVAGSGVCRYICAMHRIAVVGLGVLIAAIAMEALLHLSDRYVYDALTYDKNTGLILYKSDTDYLSVSNCFNIVAHINSMGYFAPEISPQKEPGTKRILIIGSSFVEENQVPLEKRYDSLLQQRLNATADTHKYEVAGFGFPSNGTYLTMLYYKNYLAQLHPDLVIDMMVTNDLEKDAPTTVNPPRFSDDGKAILELPAVKRDNRVLAIKDLARKSKLFEALYEQYLNTRAILGRYLHPEALKQATSTESSEHSFSTDWSTEEKLLTQLRDMVVESGGAFALASWTNEGVSDRAYMSKGLTPIAQKNHLSYVDLTPIIDQDEARTGKSATLVCNAHWGEDGQVYVADALTSYLKAHPSLLK